jgi:hypothetical protein
MPKRQRSEWLEKMRKFYEAQIVRLAKFASPNYQEIGDSRNELNTVLELIAVNEESTDAVYDPPQTSEDAQREKVGALPKRGPGRPRKVDLSAEVVIPEPDAA